MITIIEAPPEKMLGYIAGGAYQPGQWVFVSGYSATDVMPKVYHLGIAGTLATGITFGTAFGRVFPITRYPIDDLEWDLMNVAGWTCTALDHVIGLVGGNVVIEDSELMQKTGTTLWTATTAIVGTPLRLNLSGFPIPSTDLVGFPTVAVIEAIDLTAVSVIGGTPCTGIVQYRTLN
jgi:hypothetical protein